MLRSFVKDIVVVYLTYKIIVLGVQSMIPLSVIIATLVLFLFTLWFRLEKWGII